MKLYLIQISATYGSNKFCFLPYSVGSLWSYAVSNEVVKQNYFLEDIFFLREDFDKVLNRMDNPSVVAFSLYVWNENYALSLAKKIKENLEKKIGFSILNCSKKSSKYNLTTLKDLKD